MFDRSIGVLHPAAKEVVDLRGAGLAAYHSDGILISANINGTSTSCTQDLAGGMSQILASSTGSVPADYLRDDGGSLLASLTGGTRTWYGTDDQGSVRQTLDDTAAVLVTPRAILVDSVGKGVPVILGKEVPGGRRSYSR
jgi:hypothetical protein